MTDKARARADGPPAAQPRSGQRGRVSLATNGQEVREGDIVVTRVARHYSLGRLRADGQTQTPIESLNDRSTALRRACFLAGTSHRVFVWERAGNVTVYRQLDCLRQVALLPPDPR